MCKTKTRNNWFVAVYYFSSFINFLESAIYMLCCHHACIQADVKYICIHWAEYFKGQSS